MVKEANVLGSVSVVGMHEREIAFGHANVVVIVVVVIALVLGFVRNRR